MFNNFSFLGPPSVDAHDPTSVNRYICVCYLTSRGFPCTAHPRFYNPIISHFLYSNPGEPAI